jgi:hypothetical protein
MENMENGPEKKEEKKEEKMSEGVVEPVVPEVTEPVAPEAEKSHVRRLKVIKHVNSIVIVHSETLGKYSCMAPSYAKTADQQCIGAFDTADEAIAFASSKTEYKRKRGRPKKEIAAVCEILNPSEGKKEGEENKG